MSAPGGVSPVLAAALELRREEWNARFVHARRRWPSLDAQAFASFLRTCVDPLVVAVGAVAEQRVTPVLAVAYDVGLELAAQRLVGPGARHPWIERGWQQALPPGAARIAEAPEKLLPALSNAFHALTTVPGALPERFVAGIATLMTQRATADEVLRAGQALSWRCGLAQYRRGALQALRSLPEHLAGLVLGSQPGSDVRAAIARCELDPWFDPSLGQPGATPPPARPFLARSVGAFRGFGGVFLAPPVVVAERHAEGEALIVHSAGEAFLLCVDGCGASLHRIAAPKPPPVLPITLPPALAALLAADKGKTTSVARAVATLAVTKEHSHAIDVIALPLP